MSSAVIMTSEALQPDALQDSKRKPQLPPKPHLKTLVARDKSQRGTRSIPERTDCTESKVLTPEDISEKTGDALEGISALEEHAKSFPLSDQSENPFEWTPDSEEIDISKLSLTAEASDRTKNETNPGNCSFSVPCAPTPRRKTWKKTMAPAVEEGQEQGHSTANVPLKKITPRRPSFTLRTKKCSPLGPSKPLQRSLKAERSVRLIKSSYDDVFLTDTLECPKHCPCVCHLKQFHHAQRSSSGFEDSTDGLQTDHKPSLFTFEPCLSPPAHSSRESAKPIQNSASTNSLTAPFPTVKLSTAVHSGAPHQSSTEDSCNVNRPDHNQTGGVTEEGPQLQPVGQQKLMATQSCDDLILSSENDPLSIYCTMKSVWSSQEDGCRELQMSPSVEDPQQTDTAILCGQQPKLCNVPVTKEVALNTDNRDYVEIDDFDVVYGHQLETSWMEKPPMPPPLPIQKSIRNQKQRNPEKQATESSENRSPLPLVTWGVPLTDWKSRLEHEPFYQIYSQDCINREIKEQLFSASSSDDSSDYCSLILSPSYDVTKKPPTQESAHLNQKSTCCKSSSEGDADVQSPSQQAPEKQDNEERSPSDNVVSRRGIQRKKSVQALWQEMSLIQEHGILTSLGDSELRLQESLFEVLSSEASYLRSLKVVTNSVMTSPELNSILSVQEKRALFSTINRIEEASERFLADLESHLEENLMMTNTCEILQHHAKNNFSVYIDYIRNQPYQERTFQKLMKEKPQFAEVISRLQEDPGCNRLPLKSFLVLPFQRLTRLKILAENILKRTEPKSEREELAAKALREVSKVLEECNKEVGIMKRTEEMVHIANRIEFTKMKAIPLISHSRWLIKQGEMLELSAKENFFGQKKFLTVYLFLFNDVLLITVRKGGDKFAVQDHAHRSLIEIREDNIDTDTEGTFTLVLVQNHRGSISERVLKACNETERKRWIEALSPKMRENKEEDKVYEEWDCPQAQCLEAYTAQQEDELSLEPADVVSILQKTADGWYEGKKVSDEKRGWFPSSCVEEIMSEYVRRKNLRERYRVLLAAERLGRKGDGLPTKLSL